MNVTESVITPSLKAKVSEVWTVCEETAERLMDFIWNIWCFLNNRDIVLRKGTITPIQIERERNEFSQVVQKVISLSSDEIVKELNKNKPNEKGTKANIASIKETFLN